MARKVRRQVKPPGRQARKHKPSLRTQRRVRRPRHTTEAPKPGPSPLGTSGLSTGPHPTGEDQPETRTRTPDRGSHAPVPEARRRTWPVTKHPRPASKDPQRRECSPRPATPNEDGPSGKSRAYDRQPTAKHNDLDQPLGFAGGVSSDFAWRKPCSAPSPSCFSPTSRTSPFVERQTSNIEP